MVDQLLGLNYFDDHSACYVDEYDRNSDIVDPEVEANLYSQIYHRELEYDSVIIDKSTNDLEDVGVQDNRVVDTETRERNVRSESPSIRRKSYFIIDDEETGCDNNKETTFSFQLTGRLRNGNHVRMTSSKRRKLRDMILRCEPSEVLANYSVFEIQQYLAGTSSDWNICNEDLHSNMFGHRYYRDRTQTMHCKRCSEFGHIARQCKAKLKPSCSFCGGDHIMWRCKERFYCVICLQPGHLAQNCKQSLDALKRTCDRCGYHGHEYRDCPDRWRQFHSTILLHGEQVRLKRHGLLSNFEPKPIYCYNCGHSGHLGYECGQPTSYGGRIICFPPHVNVYDKEFVLGSPTESGPLDNSYNVRQNRKRRPEFLDRYSEDRNAKRFKKTQSNGRLSVSDSYGISMVGRKNFEKLKKSLKTQLHFDELFEAVDKPNSSPNKTNGNDSVTNNKRRTRSSSRRSEVMKKDDVTKSEVKRSNKKKCHNGDKDTSKQIKDYGGKSGLDGSKVGTFAWDSITDKDMISSKMSRRSAWF